MKVRRISLEEDYADIAKWWKTQNRAILAWDVLPVLGFLAEENDKKIAVSWLYCSDSVTGFVGWTTVNPASPKKQVALAIKALQQAIADAARVTKMRVLFQFSGGGGFSRMLLKSGWKNTMIQHDFLMKEV